MISWSTVVRHLKLNIYVVTITCIPFLLSYSLLKFEFSCLYKYLKILILNRNLKLLGSLYNKTVTEWVKSNRKFSWLMQSRLNALSSDSFSIKAIMLELEWKKKPNVQPQPQHYLMVFISDNISEHNARVRRKAGLFTFTSHLSIVFRPTILWLVPSMRLDKLGFLTCNHFPRGPVSPCWWQLPGHPVAHCKHFVLYVREVLTHFIW